LTGAADAVKREVDRPPAARQRQRVAVHGSVGEKLTHVSMRARRHFRVTLKRPKRGGQNRSQRQQAAGKA